MDLDLSDEQRELEDSVKEVLSREHAVQLSRRVVEHHEGSDKEVDDLWARMVSLDWPALTVPESSGGLGLGAVELAVVCEQLGHALAPGPFLSTASQYVTALRLVGTPEQQHEFLDPVAVHGMAGTLAVAETTGSFDPASVEATFRPAPDAGGGGGGGGTGADADADAGAGAAQGGGFVLDGVKAFVLEATRARNIIVVARSAGSTGSTGSTGSAGPTSSVGPAGSTGASGLAMFVVPSDSEGVDITPMSILDSTRELSVVTLSSVVVPARNMLGDPGGTDKAPSAEVLSALSAVLEEATVMLAAEMVGTCQRIVDIIIEHAMTREQFGVKIGSFQSMKHKLANMYVAVESARATVRYAAAAIAESDPRRTLAVSMAKASAGDCERLVGVEGIQCLGGIGYTWEHDMHLYVKRVRTGAALFGTAAQHRARVAELIGL